MRAAIFIGLIHLIGGCSSLSPEARRVMVLQHDAVVSSDCVNMGPIYYEREQFSFGLIDDGLREMAAKKGADTVVLVSHNSPGLGHGPSGHAIAMKCAK